MFFLQNRKLKLDTNGPNTMCVHTFDFYVGINLI